MVKEPDSIFDKKCPLCASMPVKEIGHLSQCVRKHLYPTAEGIAEGEKLKPIAVVQYIEQEQKSIPDQVEKPPIIKTSIIFPMQVAAVSEYLEDFNQERGKLNIEQMVDMSIKTIKDDFLPEIIRQAKDQIDLIMKEHGEDEKTTQDLGPKEDPPTSK